MTDPIVLAKALAAARLNVRGTGQVERPKPGAPEEGDRTPNWDKWRLIPKPAPWQCVALSLNIDPDKVKVSKDSWMAGEAIFEESQEFKDRMDIVKANLYGVLKGNSHAIDLREFAAWVHRIGWEAPHELLAIGDQRPQITMADEQVAIKADRAHSGNRTATATATREAGKANRLGALKRFTEDVYEALDKAGHEIGHQSGDRKPLPVSADDLHTLFLVRHPEHMVARSTFDDDLGTIATLKPGPKRYEINQLAEMLAGKFSD